MMRSKYLLRRRRNASAGFLRITKMDESISKFVNHQLKLLLLEREENLHQFFKDVSPTSFSNLEFVGQALTKLSITNVIEHGPDRFHIDLERANGLPLEHILSSGDGVNCIRVKCLQFHEKQQILKAVVISIDESKLSISANDWYENVEENEVFTIVKTDSDFTYNSQTRALHFLKRECYTSCCLPIIQILFDTDTDKVHDLLILEDSITKPCVDDDGKLKFINQNLVKDQKLAVEFGLKRRHFAIIQGPPGTGKTTTLIEIIEQLYLLGKKILICAPTNVAVDNLVVRLGETQAKPLRLGNPSRISAEALKYSLDLYVEQDDSTKFLKSLKRTIKNLEREIEKSDKKYLYRELKALKREYKTTLNLIISDIFRRSSVILCTLTSSSLSDSHLRFFPSNYFDVLIVDEASQAMEASMWIAIPHAPKLILAGDINQLPPVVMSDKAAKGGLNLSLMERGIQKLKDDCYIRLTRQYRMNEKIMAWSNKKFYNDTLEADTSVKNHILNDLPYIKKNNSLTSEAIVYIDTCGCECEELNTGVHLGSKGNLGEVVIVDKIVTTLIDASVKHKDIGVISPYALQVDFIRKSLKQKSIDIEVSTVDGFQGMEKEVVILSLVRSNQDRELGFVTDFRRLNVAVTRARRLLIVIADSETMEKNDLITSLLKHIEDDGLVQTAEEYLKDRSNREIEYNTKTSKNNLKHKVKLKTKIKSLKKEEKKISEISETKDNKKSTEKIKTKAVPKLNRKRIDISMDLHRNKYNIFKTIDAMDSGEVPESVSEDNHEPDLDLFKNLHISKKEKKKQMVQNKVNINKEVNDNDNIDEIKIIEKFIKLNNVCSYSGCKISTKIIKLDCEFCRKCYCVQHGLQEIHGCGNAIRQKEHKAFRQKKKPEITITKRDKDKFAQKIKEFTEARKPKKKSTK